MSIFSLPRGIHRNSDAAFKPNTMIDVLFDYDKFLGEEFSIHSKQVPTPKDAEDAIAILGAGAAGLIAGILLKKAGYNVKIYEASNRVGGRMYSVYPDGKAAEKNVFELGCMRFPPTSKVLFKLLKKYSIQTKENFPDPGSYGVLTTLFYKNQSISWPGAKKQGEHSLPEDSRFQKIGYNFGCVMRKLLGDPNDLNAAGAGELYKHWAAYQAGTASKDPLIKVWQDLINRFKNKSFYEAMFEITQIDEYIFSDAVALPRLVTQAEAKRKWTEADMDAFGALGVGSGGFGPLYAVNFLEILRIIANGWEDEQVLIPSGASNLADKLFEEFRSLKGVVNLGKQYQFAMNETEIIGDPTQIWLKENSNKTICFAIGERFVPTECLARGMIVATTNCAAEMTQVTIASNPKDVLSPKPLITADQKVAVRNLSMMSSSKFFIRVSKRFWLDSPDCPSNIQTDELPRGVYCLDYGDGDTGVVLISYTWGNDSLKLQTLTKKQRYQYLLNALEKASPAFADGIKRYGQFEIEVLPFNNYIDWQSAAHKVEDVIPSANHAYGAFKLNWPGQEQMCRDGFFNVQFPQGKGGAATYNTPPLFLAGDSYSWAGGWIEGALTSGINAACGVMQALDPLCLKPNSPAVKEGISPNQYSY